MIAYIPTYIHTYIQDDDSLRQGKEWGRAGGRYVEDGLDWVLSIHYPPIYLPTTYLYKVDVKMKKKEYTCLRDLYDDAIDPDGIWTVYNVCLLITYTIDVNLESLGHSYRDNSSVKAALSWWWWSPSHFSSNFMTKQHLEGLISPLQGYAWQMHTSKGGGQAHRQVRR